MERSSTPNHQPTFKHKSEVELTLVLLGLVDSGLITVASQSLCITVEGKGWEHL